MSSGGDETGSVDSNVQMPHLSVCADSHKVDRTKLAQSEVKNENYVKLILFEFLKPFCQFQFPIIEFDGETFRILLTYLHCGSCTLSCLNIPGLICAAEHYDLPELLQACFHHAKQFIRVDKVCYCIFYSFVKQVLSREQASKRIGS